MSIPTVEVRKNEVSSGKSSNIFTGMMKSNVTFKVAAVISSAIINDVDLEYPKKKIHFIMYI